MDLDIEMDDAVDAVHDAPIIDIGRDDILQPDEPEEPGEVAEDETPTDDSKTLIPTKIHIKGVDSLHTSDIKAYVKAHFGDVDRIEWIDDSSANLLFPSEPTARDAIVALSSVPVADATALAIGETLPAKPFEGKPEISLQVRFAIQSDKKEVGAALRSRYYLLHPEHDPEERRRRNQENRSRYRDRDDGYHRGGEGRRRRASDDDVETFEASMYDDAPRPTRRRRDSDIEERPRSYARENQGKELTRARDLKDRISGSNNSKELFPTKKSIKQFGGGNLDTLERAIGSARLKDEDRPKIVSVPNARGDGNSFNIRGMASQQGSGEGFAIKGAASANARELFPTKLDSNNTGKELFGGGRSKQRQKAEDLFS
ncbi:hypothetical protein DER46DRAFT_495037 [Fusarium sp. MPI-SDFR-AT-0072]|nr:hypothetical protein DER46DRAFT_495037 [Fusarium sp. MPI-SDFR-AT-0072]